MRSGPGRYGRKRATSRSTSSSIGWSKPWPRRRGRVRQPGPDGLRGDGPLEERARLARWQHAVEAQGDDVQAGRIAPAGRQREPDVERPDAEAEERAVLVPRRRVERGVGAPEGALLDREGGALAE